MNDAASQEPTLSLFHADALILVGAVALVLLLAGIAAMLSWRTRSRVVAIASLLALLVLAAFLPFWTSLLTLLLVSDENRGALSSWYLWLMFAAVINLGWVFAMGTLVSGVVHVAIPGTHRARLARTLVCLAIVWVVAIVYILIQLHRQGLLR